MDYRSFANGNGKKRESTSNGDSQPPSTNGTSPPETNGAQNGTTSNGNNQVSSINGTDRPWRANRGNHPSSSNQGTHSGTNGVHNDTTSSSGIPSLATNGTHQPWRSNRGNHSPSTNHPSQPEKNSTSTPWRANRGSHPPSTNRPLELERNGTNPPWRANRGNHSPSTSRFPQSENNDANRGITSTGGNHVLAANGNNQPWRSNGNSRHAQVNGTYHPQTTNTTNTPATINGTSHSSATNGAFHYHENNGTPRSTATNGFNRPPATNENTVPTSPNGSSSSTISSEDGYFPEPDIWDVMQFRYHHEVNLGGSFILDKAISPSMFCEGCDESELGAVSSNVQRYGVPSTRARWEKHWHDSLTEKDLWWLSNIAKCTTIRIPIGYFILGEQFVQDTPFNRYSLVYVNAWLALKDMVARARNWGIGTLLVFDSIPGGRCEGSYPNGTDDLAERVGMKKHADLIRTCLMYIAVEVKTMDGIVGLQLSSRTLIQPTSSAWYHEMIDMVGMMNDTLPIYIPDDGNLERCLRNLRQREFGILRPRRKKFLFGSSLYTLSHPCSNPIIVDSHFRASRVSAEPLLSLEWHQIMDDAQRMLEEKFTNRKASVVNQTAFQVVVGRYSSFLPEEYPAGFNIQEQHVFAANCGRMQNKIWQQHAGGAYFWTLKGEMSERLGDAWRFTTQTEINGCSAPAHFFYSVEEVLQRINRAQNCYYTACISSLFFLPQMPRKEVSLESQMGAYIVGWVRGFRDARAFYSMRTSGKLGDQVIGGADKIGCLEAWVRKRVLELGIKDINALEFEKGIRKGIPDFYRLVDA